MNSRIAAALGRAREDAERGFAPVPPDGRARARRVAVGDPQAPFAKFLEVLDRHGVLGDDGRVAADAHVVSMGDHFDWGTRAQREDAAADSKALLSWLAAHAPDHVTIIAGNHDLARMGELATFDDHRFAEVRAEADTIYLDGKVKDADDRAFRSRHPALTSAEVAARDFGAFRTEQRKLVVDLLRAKRMRLAHAEAPDLLLVHAGATEDELAAAGVPAPARRDAFAIAEALNGALDAAFAGWDDATAFEIPKLHRPGSAKHGEARGMLFHRPSNPTHESPELFEGPPRRRFDPRRLPRLAQVIGHIRDNKCRRLLRDWHDGATPQDGPLRVLETDGREVRYAHGTRARGDVATVYFTDGAMLQADPAAYEIFDLTRRAPAPRR